MSFGAIAVIVCLVTVLAGIAATQPRSLDDLSTIAGIGAKKLERYGPALLELLRS